MKRLTLLIAALFIAISVNSPQDLHAQLIDQAIDQDTKEATAFFETFLKTWLIDQDIDKAVAYFSQSDEYANTIKSVFDIPPQEPFDLNLWLRKSLVMWLFANHSKADLLGHGDPTHDAYDFLPVKPGDARSRIQPKDLADVIYEIKKQAETNKVFGAVILRHAPRDVIIFQIEKIDDGWKIFSYLWMIN